MLVNNCWEADFGIEPVGLWTSNDSVPININQVQKTNNERQFFFPCGVFPFPIRRTVRSMFVNSSNGNSDARRAVSAHKPSTLHLPAGELNRKQRRLADQLNFRTETTSRVE